MLIRSIQKGLLFRSPIVLKEHIGVSASVPAKPEEDLVGKTGVVVTPLRPSGTILIDGKRVNVKTQARFIEKDQTVTVIASDGLDWIVE
jgi:membrane-bound serine protease (ClpP class)